MAKKDNKFYRYYREHRSICNWVLVGILFALTIAFNFLTGTLKVGELKPFLGSEDKPLFSVQMTWFSWVMVAILLVCLVLAIVFMIQNRSEKAQEKIQYERIEAAKLQQEALDERQREVEAAYNRMKERRAARLATKQAEETTAAEEPAQPKEE